MSPFTGHRTATPIGNVRFILTNNDKQATQLRLLNDSGKLFYLAPILISTVTQDGVSERLRCSHPANTAYTTPLVTLPSRLRCTLIGDTHSERTCRPGVMMPLMLYCHITSPIFRTLGPWTMI